MHCVRDRGASYRRFTDVVCLDFLVESRERIMLGFGIICFQPTHYYFTLFYPPYWNKMATGTFTHNS